MPTPVVRVQPGPAPLEAIVALESEGGAWRPLLVTRGVDALARAQDLARLIEAGLLSVVAPPLEVAAQDHPEPWVTLADAVRALQERPSAVLERIERGELRHLEDADGIHVHAEDMMRVFRREVLPREALAAWTCDVLEGAPASAVCLCPGHAAQRARAARGRAS